MKRVAILVCLVFLFSCKEGFSPNEAVVAIVGNKKLYVSDVKKKIIGGLSYSDSLEMAKSYINEWVLEQLLLEKAEANLSEEDLDFTKQVEQYRKKLVIHKYRQKFIQQKLDTEVSPVELDEYYKMYSSKFILEQTIVKGKIFKADPQDAEYRKQSKNINSSKISEQKKFEKYCDENLEHWEFDKYVTIPEFVQPCRSIRLSRVTRGGINKYKTVWSEDGVYYVKITGIHKKGEVAPIEWVEDKIKDKIIDVRKRILFLELDKNLVKRQKEIGHVKIK